MSTPFAESVVEGAALAWLDGLGYGIVAGSSISPGEMAAEREDWRQAILDSRLCQALARLNPELPKESLDEAFKRIVRADGTTPEARNRTVHRMLLDGVTVEYRRPDGSIAGAQARVLDFDDPENNDWLAVNQFTIQGDQHVRRLDIVIFVNGLPLGVMELKNAADEKADVWTAFNQLQTYQLQIPTLFAYNAAMVASDGIQARIGSLGAGREWFKPWRTITGQKVADAHIPELHVLIEGVFEKRRFLDLIRHFIVFEDEGGGKLIKKMAGYHQFHAVNMAIEETIRASRQAGYAEMVAESRDGYRTHPQHGGEPGDQRVGVVWHTQGSGKSLTMAFYAGRVVLAPEMKNPTIVVITDRNDLDDQLFGTFARCKELLRQEPVQATDRADLRRKLRVNSGGVVFTTIQKFMPDERGDKHPILSERSNIVVIADEAHRSQYDFVDGLAAHLRDALPKASFIGFTGTPIEKTDANTRAVFGDYISVYDIRRAVEDGATVPIYYESRLAKLALSEDQKPKVDPEFEEVTEGEEIERKDRLRSRWAQLESVVGTDSRLEVIAQDLVRHYDERCAAMEGKAMVVCMSRRICVNLYNQIIKLRPEWDSSSDEAGVLKVIMTGNPSETEYQAHIRSKGRREKLAERFRNPDDHFRMVIVRDMWLTGFDAPSLHTMYVDKPMRGHGLMQAIARVNRVFRDKPGGLVVDYLGLAQELRNALANYTDSGGEGDAAKPMAEAVAALRKWHEICAGMFHGFDWSKWMHGTPQERLSVLPAAQEHILALPDKQGKPRLLAAVTDLSRAFALAVPSDEALALRDDVAFFQAVRAALVKNTGEAAKTKDELNHAIRQIVSKAVVPDGMLDIFAAAGLTRPNIGILSDEFMAEVRDLPQKNLAVEALAKLLKDEIKTRSKRNVVQGKSFLEMLEKTLIKYQNRAIETAQVIEELIELAKEMREAERRGEELGLTESELAFYDALETNDSAVKVLGDDTLRGIAREVADTVRNNVTIDWTVRENVRAQLRVLVKRILRKHGYPPDKQEKAVATVIQQAELITADWAYNPQPK